MKSEKNLKKVGIKLKKVKYLLLVLLLSPIWVQAYSGKGGNYGETFGENWYGSLKNESNTTITSRAKYLGGYDWTDKNTGKPLSKRCNNYKALKKNTGNYIIIDSDEEISIKFYEIGSGARVWPVEATFELQNNLGSVTHYYPIIQGLTPQITGYWDCPTLVVLGQYEGIIGNWDYGTATLWLKYSTTKDTVVIQELNKSQNINDDKIAIFCQINPDTGTCKFLDVEDVPTQHSTKKEIKCPENDDENNYIKACACLPAGVADITSRLYMLLKIAAPAILIIVGGFDMIKAMSAQDEKGIKSAQTKLIRKFVVAAAIFLLFSLAQWIVSLLATNEANAENILNCLNNLLNGYNI